jgi:hypothetical protein
MRQDEEAAVRGGIPGTALPNSDHSGIPQIGLASSQLQQRFRSCVWRIDRVTDFAAHPAKVRQVALF